MPTNGACLRGVMGVYLDRHALVAHGFVSNHRMQLSKRPLRVGGICLALLLRRLLAMFAFGALTNVCQMLQPDQAVRMLIYDMLGDTMIGVGFQPSLPIGNGDQAPRGRAGAFSLQTLPQSRVMIGLSSDTSARMEGTFAFRGRGHGEVAGT